MAFNARVYRILIASPSDVAPERDVAVKVIQEWNDLHAQQRGITLLPLRWETHSTPELGDRPQAIINRQIVVDADALIGIFWTRVGSHTGVAESGTLEEIQVILDSKRPAMLYFSTAPRSPDEIDTDQLERLRAFKSRQQKEGLTQNYASLNEFRDHLSRHIEVTVRRLASESDEDQRSTLKVPPHPAIHFSFLPEMGNVESDGTLQVKVQPVIIKDPENLPDYEGPAKPVKRTVLGLEAPSIWTPPNINYYRAYAAYLRDLKAARRLCLLAINEGGIGARDVYIEINLTSDKEFTVLNQHEIMADAPSKTASLITSGTFKSNYSLSRGWKTSGELGALQPQRRFEWRPKIFVSALTNCEIKLNIRIFADAFAQPHECELFIDWVAEPEMLDAEKFVEGLTVGSEPPVKGLLDTLKEVAQNAPDTPT